MLEKYARQDSILVVGHNPNLREFLGRVISASGCEAAVELKKGAVAKVEIRRSSGSLSWCITPRILRTLLRGRGRKLASEELRGNSRGLSRSPTLPDPRSPCRAQSVSSRLRHREPRRGRAERTGFSPDSWPEPGAAASMLSRHVPARAAGGPSARPSPGVGRDFPR